MSAFIRADFTSADSSAPKATVNIPAPPLIPPIMSDTFKRADSTDIGTTETGNFKWTNPGPYEIQGLALSAGNTSTIKPADCWVDPGKTSGTITAKITNLGGGDHAGIVFRKSTENNTAFVYYAQAVGYRLAKRTAADGFTVLERNGTGVVWTVGQVAKIEYTPDKIICSVDGVITHTHDNIDYNTQTGVGLEVRNSTAENPATWTHIEFYA